MFFSDNHATGFFKCTPIGGVARTLGALTGVIGILSLVITVPLIIAKLLGYLNWIPLFVLILMSPAIIFGGIAANVLGKYLAYRKNFEYFYKEDRCVWNGGQFPPVDH